MTRADIPLKTRLGAKSWGAYQVVDRNSVLSTIVDEYGLIGIISSITIIKANHRIYVNCISLYLFMNI